jgi:hypothetical protein
MIIGLHLLESFFNGQLADFFQNISKHYFDIDSLFFDRAPCYRDLFVSEN